MVKKQKRYQRMINDQKNISFNDFVFIILAFGFKQNRVTGSHHIYDHPDVPQSVSVQPDGNQAKPYQIRQFLRLIKKYNLTMTDKTDTDETDQDTEGEATDD
ncbi:MAG: type II toxin-antitoxin system HicA family toxin [Armatimonadetes bacterium]|nr:type II toxin-antitoxin system HicA family toxin [Anaerolineae bacterium]